MTPPFSPPPLPHPQRLRQATAANTFLPGAGLYLLGRRRIGASLALIFLGCFSTVLVLFLSGYVNYLSTALGEDLMKGDRLERAGAGFHERWLIALGIVGLTVYLISLVLLVREKRRQS